MISFEKQYLNLAEDIVKNGHRIPDRTGTGTYSLFGKSLEHDMKDGFPLLTTKYVNLDAISSELIWFLEGSTDERRLAEIRYGEPRNKLQDKKTIWTANAEEQGVKLGNNYLDTIRDLGPIYGKQWTNWLDENGFGINQIQNLINLVKNHTYGRRFIVNAWNVAMLDKMALPPCHYAFQVCVRDANMADMVHELKLRNIEFDSNNYEQIASLVEKEKIPTKMMTLIYNQRSADLFLGVPFNIASYSLLLMLICKEVNMLPDRVVAHMGDVHVYLNHVEQIQTQISRTTYVMPTLKIQNFSSVFQLKMEDLKLENYEHHNKLTGKMAV